MLISGAYIQLCGTVIQGIEIKRTEKGKEFGLFRIQVSKRISFDSDTDELTHGERRYSAFIWDKELFKLAKQLLIKGKKVRLFGELDYIPVKILPSDVFLANSPEEGLVLTINITKISSDTQRKGSKDIYYPKNKFQSAHTKTVFIQNNLEGGIQ
ncbi:single-stranded DNA-binding protein [Candidatus Jidaibacter acanthamoebae]|nr:single-stranded DNA-binding protein [Candidatus Jidaibacter acanthamoeba]